MMTTTPKTVAPSSLVRASALVLLSKHGPLDKDHLHAKVDGMLQTHGYAPIALGLVGTALWVLNAQKHVQEDETGSSRFVSAEEGDNILRYVVVHMEEGTKDAYAIACVLSHEARV